MHSLEKKPLVLNVVNTTLLNVVQTFNFPRKIVQKGKVVRLPFQNAKVFTQLLLSIIRVGLVVERSFL